jgi:hypothetical protein
MKLIQHLRTLVVSLVAISLIIMLTFTTVNAAAAQPQFRLPSESLSEQSSFYLADAAIPSNKDWLTQLKTEILPQLETIFTPEQLEQFETDIGNGTSFRKAFKALVLTPNQKAQLKTLLKSIPKKDAFASLTPEQKQQLFLKKKELFRPTSDEIVEKINAGMKTKGAELPAGVKEKIDAAMKRRDTFMPTSESITESITEKIQSAISGIKDKLPD